MLFWRAALPLSRQTLSYVAGVIRRHRAAIGSCWRKLNPGQQAMLVLAHLRKGETLAELAAGFRHQHRHGLEIRHRDHAAPCRPRPEAGPRCAPRSRPGTRSP
jgi:hypothetical protein